MDSMDSEIPVPTPPAPKIFLTWSSGPRAHRSEDTSSYQLRQRDFLASLRVSIHHL
jgi:hypothetical protein